MVEAVRGTGRNVVGVPGSPRFLVSRVLRGNKARVLFRAGTRAGPGPLYRGRGSRNSRCSIVEGRPFRNKGPLIFHLPDLTAPLDSSTRPYGILTYSLPAYVTVSLALTPTGVLRTLCSNPPCILSIRSPIVYGILMIPYSES